MTDSSTPFLADGISLGIPNNSATEIEHIDNAIFLDENGEMNFKDSYVAGLSDINGDPIKTLKLRDIYTRINGIYLGADGRLYFKDSSTTKAYSLKQLVSSYAEWKNKLTTGGLYWLSSNKITEVDCNNIKINMEGNPNLPINTTGISGAGRIYIKYDNGSVFDYPSNSSGTKVFSIDKYCIDYTTTDGGDYRLQNDGSWRWHDVPKVNITIPPIDENKALMILGKVNTRLIKTEGPLVFRLYDKTTETELDRKTVANGDDLPVEQQPFLSYFGVLPTFQSKINKIGCQCPTQDQLSSETEPPHVIAIQFHTEDRFTDISTNYVYGSKVNTISEGVYDIVDDTSNKQYHPYERRIIGFPNVNAEDPLVNSSIDVVIWDTTKNDNFGRKAGNIIFTNQDIKEVVFEVPFSSSSYSISLSCDKNINIWYTNKKNTGFVIKSERKLTGNVDWIATKLKFEGDA